MDQGEKNISSAMERSRMDIIPAPNRQSFPEPLRSESGNLEKVRDILFGPQARDYDKRLTRLEERLLKEAAELRDDLRKRYDALENYIKKEVEALGDRLKAEQNERVETSRKLGHELKDIGDLIDKKTSHLAEQASLNQRELREQLLERSRTLSDEMQQKYGELSTAVARHVQELRLDMTDRVTLAALLTEVAMRLNNEWHYPGADSGL